MARSGLPSPFMSAITTPVRVVPAANVAWPAYDGVEAPGAVVLKSTLTELESRLAMVRSGLPSPFMSAMATDRGLFPTANEAREA